MSARGKGPAWGVVVTSTDQCTCAVSTWPVGMPALGSALPGNTRGSTDAARMKALPLRVRTSCRLLALLSSTKLCCTALGSAGAHAPTGSLSIEQERPMATTAKAHDVIPSACAQASAPALKTQHCGTSMMNTEGAKLPGHCQELQVDSIVPMLMSMSC